MVFEILEIGTSHDTFEDAQDYLARVKYVPGFKLAYIVRGKPETVLICHFRFCKRNAGEIEKLLAYLHTGDHSSDVLQP